MTPPSACALCRASAPLRDSHIFPKFIVRWIRETSATGKLRSNVNIRRRHQDALKKPLLCGTCEQRFSNHEKWFSEGVFRPKLDGQVAHPELEHPSLLPFVASLAWRAAQVDGSRLRRQYPRHHRSISRAMERWRRYLLDPALPAGNHFFFPLPDQVFLDGGDRVNWYLHRSVDLTAILVHRRPSIWWKVPGFAGISCFGGHMIPGGQFHRLTGLGLTRAAWTAPAPPVVVDMIMDRSRGANERIEQMSSDHWATIAKDYRKNLDDWVDSPAARTAESDFLNARWCEHDDPEVG